jgi:predicted nucleic acid-binding protein
MVDATVLIAGVAWPRWSYEVLRHALARDYQLVLSPLVVEQARRWFRKNLPVAEPRFDQFLSSVGYSKAKEPTKTQIDQHPTLVRDAKDIPIALAAINADVDYFVSEDKDFTDEDATTYEVRQRLNIMRPVIFLREVMGWTSEELEAIRHRDWTR